LGGNFLDYGILYKILGVPIPEARSLGILGVELGVALAVMAVMCTIFLAIFKVGGGEQDEGGQR
jgi:multicomponent Na+:H+ antiporter subunit B